MPSSFLLMLKWTNIHVCERIMRQKPGLPGILAGMTDRSCNGTCHHAPPLGSRARGTGLFAHGVSILKGVTQQFSPAILSFRKDLALPGSTILHKSKTVKDAFAQARITQTPQIQALLLVELLLRRGRLLALLSHTILLFAITPQPSGAMVQEKALFSSLITSALNPPYALLPLRQK